VINSSPNSAVPVSTDDFVAVQRLLHCYADAVVHRDAVRWASCWADDATWELSPGSKVIGKAAIVDVWSRAMGGFTSVLHVVHNGDALMTDDPERAVGRWYVDERFLLANGQTGMMLAHYDDEYRRAAGGWVFTSRVLHMHYRGPADLSGEFLNTPYPMTAT
jgi:ketosteroid isomerase-like protein